MSLREEGWRNASGTQQSHLKTSRGHLDLHHRQHHYHYHAYCILLLAFKTVSAVNWFLDQVAFNGLFKVAKEAVNYF